MSDLARDEYGIAQMLWALHKLGGSATRLEAEQEIENFTFEDEIEVLRVEQNVKAQKDTS
jgi:hypothetical protein